MEFENTESFPHAEHCEECSQRLSIFRFLGFQVKNAPGMDTPPFFSKRVSQLIRSAKVSFAFSLQQAVRQLIPVFMGLFLATSLLLYWMTDTDSAIEQYSELFFEQPLQEDLSIDYVVDFLGDVLQEEPVP